MLSDEDVAWLAAAPDFLRIPEHNVVAVHAGFLPGVAPEATPHGVCIRCRWVTPAGEQASAERDEGGRIVQPPDSVPWAARYDGAHHVVYVKMAWPARQRNFAVSIRKSKTNRRRFKFERYKPADFDFLIAWVVSTDAFYVLPSKFACSFANFITLRESGNMRQPPRSLAYRNNWDQLLL